MVTAVALPRPARVYIDGVVLLGLGCVGVAAALLPPLIDAGVNAHVLVGAAVAYATLVGVQLRGLSLAWKGRHISIYIDEAVLFVSFVFLPIPIVIFLSLAASFTAMAIQRKPPVKAAFNAAGHVFAVTAAGSAYAQALRFDLEPLEAALVVPVVASTVNTITVAILLTLIAREPLRAVFKPELFAAIMLPTMVGIALGAVATLFLQIHVVVAFVMLPLSYVAFLGLTSGYKVENELAARRVLSGVSRRLVGEPSEDAIVRAAFDASREAFTLRRMQVRLDDAVAGERKWDLKGDFPDQGHSSIVRVPLADKHDRRIGELTLTVAHENEAQRAAQQELAEVVGGYLSIALGTSAALRSLAEAEARLREVFDAAPDPIFLLDEKGRVTYHNEVARREFSPEGGEVAGGALLESLDAASRGKLEERLARPTTEGLLEVTLAAPRPEEARVFDLNLSPLSPLKGHAGVLILARDITQRRRTEERLRRSERLSALGTLVAGVAHEINNPLAFMTLNLQMSEMELTGALGRDDLSPELRAQIETTKSSQKLILEGVDRIARITQSLKEVAKPAMGERGAHDVNSMVDGILAVASPRLRANTRVSRELRAKQRALVSVNEISQVLLNLMLNAADALATGGNVTVRTRDLDGGRLAIEVEDDGPGIPPDVQQRLFTPFFTTKPQGTGLGLSISYRIVEEHGGRLSFTSVPRRTTFRVELPAATPPAHAAPAPTA